MMSEYDEKVKDYWKIGYRKYIVKLIEDAGVEEKVKKLKSIPLHLEAFVLIKSERLVNNFLHANDGFYTNDIYYTDTDSLYLENKHWNQFDNAELVRKFFLQGENDYRNKEIFYGLFLAPKKNCLTINKYGVID